MRRLLVTAGLTALVMTLAVLGGRPDPARALELVSGAGVTTATTSAFIAMLCWMAVGLLVVAAAAGALMTRRVGVVGGRFRSAAALAVGVAILGIGIARHQGGYRVCCSDPTTAQQAEHLVH